MRIIILDGSSNEALEQLVKRSWSNKASVEKYTYMLENARDLLVEIGLESEKYAGSLELRYLPFVPSIGLTLVDSENNNGVGIVTTTDLLEAGKTKAGREELSEKTGVSEKLILEWVNLSDLMRIKGVGEEYSDLLEEAGVDTVVELSRRVPENLYAKMQEINETKELVRRTPTLNDVTIWVDQAKKLPRIIEY